MTVKFFGGIMKRTLVCIAFIVCISPAVHSQPTWTWQNPLPQGNDLSDVFVLDANAAVAVGFGGAFLKTTDRGASWTTIPITTGTPPKRVTQILRSVWFTDTQNGTIAGDQGIFLKTANGGAAWTVMQTPFVFDPMNPIKVPDVYSLKSIHFINGQAGWAVGSKQTFEAFVPKIVGSALKTTDGGTSWTDCSPQTQNTLNAVFFTDAQTGYTAGGTYNAALLLKTTDGGKTWTPCPNMPVYQSQSIELSALHFTSAQIGWAVGGQDLTLKTTDGGNSWEKVDWSALKYLLSPTDVFFPSANTGWIIGTTILKTTDGGISWVEQKAERIGKAVHFFGNDLGWMAGASGLITYTSDGGDDWKLQSRAATTSMINALQFVKSSLGWAAGYNGTVLKTTDGGNGWQAQSVSDETDFYSVHFIDAGTGWLVGAGFVNQNWTGQVYKTTTGGNAWTGQFTVPGKTLTDVFFIDSRTGWMTGDSGLLKKTTDGGTAWTDQPNPFIGTTQRLESVQFVDQNTGWVAAGYSGKILNTTDGGANWTEQASGTSEWLYSVHFINASTGWAAGGSALLKTTNGGTQWTKLTLPKNIPPLRTVHFFDASNGFAAGGTGGSSVVIRSTDGGASWAAEETGFSQQFNSVYAAGPALGWVAGENGAIIRYGQAAANLPPVFVSAALVQVTEKSAFLYTARATDPEGAAVGYAFSNYPAWMTAGDSTLSGIAPAGEGSASFTVSASDGVHTAVLNVSVTLLKGAGVPSGSAETVPDRFFLSEAYPNPFNPSTTVTFGLPGRAEVILQIFDVKGKRVKEVFRGVKEAGHYQASWDGTDDTDHAVSSGVYLYYISAGPFTSVQKMILIK
jgi:photosystem II stability/assembly factor-like uncharacterized protein